MSLTKEQLAQLNFGYLNGADLMQFCPHQLIIGQYEKYSNSLQVGCDQAYSEIEGELSNVYNIASEISNANQALNNQTSTTQINLTSNTYVDFIYIVPSEVLTEATITIGTSLNATDIMTARTCSGNGIIFYIRKLYTNATTLYFTINGSAVDISLTAKTGVQMPPISVKSDLNKTESYTFTIPANSYVYNIFAEILLDTPTILIGTTLLGEEIVEEQLVDNTMLPLLINQFTTDTPIYVTITGGSVNLRYDIAYNFIAPVQSLTYQRNNTLVKLLSIFAIRNILGSSAGENKLLTSHFEWADMISAKIKNRQYSISLKTASQVLKSNAQLISSSFKTIG